MVASKCMQLSMEELDVKEKPTHLNHNNNKSRCKIKIMPRLA